MVVLDTAGNELLTVGRYGNQDDAPVEGRADVGFFWFTGLGASDRYLYVADGGNHRVVRLALRHAAVERCEISNEGVGVGPR